MLLFQVVPERRDRAGHPRDPPDRDLNRPRPQRQDRQVRGHKRHRGLRGHGDHQHQL